MRTIKVESEYRAGQYHLLAVIGGSLPRRRWYASYAEMMDAVEGVNPDCQAV